MCPTTTPVLLWSCSILYGFAGQPYPLSFCTASTADLVSYGPWSALLKSFELIADATEQYWQRNMSDLKINLRIHFILQSSMSAIFALDGSHLWKFTKTLFLSQIFAVLIRPGRNINYAWVIRVISNYLWCEITENYAITQARVIFSHVEKNAYKRAQEQSARGRWLLLLVLFYCTQG